MSRKLLAVLLIACWVILSAFDLLEDFDLSIRAGIDSPLRDSVPIEIPGTDTVNNMLELGDRTRICPLGFLNCLLLLSSAGAPMIKRKSSRIHKLFHVFLI